MRVRDERGSTIPLLIFYCFLGLSVIAVVVAATSLYIERKRLFTLADGASLAATENFSIAQITRDGDSLNVHLSDEQVRRAASAYLQATGQAEAHIVSALSPDGKSARVTISASWSRPILGELIPWRLPLQVTSTARTVFD